VALNAASERGERVGGHVPAPDLDIRQGAFKGLLQATMIVRERLADVLHRKNIRFARGRRLIEIKAGHPSLGSLLTGE
jgi:hypothetical protein